MSNFLSRAYSILGTYASKLRSRNKSSGQMKADSSRREQIALNELLAAGLHRLGFLFRLRSALSRSAHAVPCLSVGSLTSDDGVSLSTNEKVIRTIRSCDWVPIGKARRVSDDVYVTKYSSPSTSQLLLHTVVFGRSTLIPGRTELRYIEVYVI